jgi:hypothetical protein
MQLYTHYIDIKNNNNNLTINVQLYSLQVDEGVFSLADRELLETLLNIAGPILQTSSFFDAKVAVDPR